MTKLPPIVEVWWDDAHFQAGEVEAMDAAQMHRPWQYCTTGYLVLSDEDGVSVSQDLGEDGSFRGRTFILRSMIKEERIIRKGKNWPRKRPKPEPTPDN